MKNVAVLGTGHTKFGSHPDKSLLDLWAEAALEAINRSNIEKEDIESLHIGQFAGSMTDGTANISGFAAAEIGLKNVVATRYEGACASSSVAFKVGCEFIRSGREKISIVGGTERLLSAGTQMGTRSLATSVDGVYEMAAGFTFPGIFAMIARLYSSEYKIPMEELREKMAHVSMKNHKHGARNPKAQFYKKMGDLSVEDVLDSREICTPLSLLDCCPMTDGATACVIAESELAKEVVDDPIHVLGMGQSSAGSLFRQEEKIVKSLPRAKSAERAFEEAGLKPGDIDLIEIHDCFTIAEIVASEAIGFFDYGSGADACEEGKTEIGGEIAINPSGGLIGKGHPVGATGTGQIHSVVRQLRQEEKHGPVKGAEIGMTDTLGGDFGTMVNIILGRK